MNENAYTNWILLTATTWEDIAGSVKLTGISFIDKDHKILANFILDINRILIQIKANKMDLTFLEKQRIILKGLYDYAVLHFGREEKLIKYYKLHCLQEQEEQHVKILKLLKSVLDDYSSGNISVSEELKLSLMDWLVNHINTYDFNSYSVSHWSEIIRNSKRIQDLFVLIKKTFVRPIDVANRDFMTKIISVFSETEKDNDISEFKKRISAASNEIQKLYELKSTFMEKYKIQGIEDQKAQHNKLKTLIDGIVKSEITVLPSLKVEVKDENSPPVPANLSDVKVEIISSIIKQISDTDYFHLNIGDITDKVLANAKNDKEITWLIQPTAIKVIDDDHMHFVKIVIDFCNKLDSAKSEIEANKLRLEMTEKMVNYAKAHFSHEEGLMDKNPDLPAIPEHKMRHKEILNSLSEIEYFIVNNHGDIFTILRSKVLNIWIAHTNGMDQTTFNRSNIKL